MADKNPSHPIKINSAPAKEIALLYGIGDKLSERIVAYREKHGPFYSPSDLANVSGISQQLAETLSTQIDWGTADEDAEEIPQRDYAYSILFLVLALFQFLSAYYIQVVQIKETIARRDIDRNIWLWIHTNFALNKIAVAFAFIYIAGSFFTVNVKNETRYIKSSVYLVLAAFVCMIFVAAGNVFYYQFYAPAGWYELFDSPADLVAGGLGVAGFILLTVVFVSWYWKHSARTMTMLRYIYNFTMVIVTLLYILWSYRYSSEIVKPSLPLITAQLGLSAFNVWQGFQLILKRSSPLDSVLLLLDEAFLKVQSQDAIASIRWMKWMNQRLPDIEEQKELQRALNKTYPPSKAKTLFGLFIISLGGWLAVTALEAIVGWFVQGWLDKIWKSFTGTL